MRAHQVSLQLLGAVLAAVFLFTAACVVWGFVTPGDYFANGSNLLLPTLVLVTAVGLVAGFRASGWVRTVFLVAAVASACFWIFVPADWWVTQLR
jgi:hypothetical protein